MRRLCFGGSFNPIHNGHLLCAQQVAIRAGFDRIVLIPASVSPHKLDDANAAPAQDRLEMCRIATAAPAAAGRFEVDDLELNRPFPSYTIDTVRELRARGWQEVHWLIGADQLMKLPYWHEAEALVREAEFVVMARPGAKLEFDRLPAAFQMLRNCVVEATLIDISATEIRRRVGRGEPIDALVPAGVAQYIQSRGLYRL